MSVEATLRSLQTDPDVVYAEPNYYLYADGLPNDPHFGLLWGLHNTGQTVADSTGTPDADIDAPEAWDVATSGPVAVVAVLDSGLDYRHPDLAPNLWTNPGEIPGNGIDDDSNGYVDDVHGWDFVAGDNASLPNDPFGHGTHVAGTIAAVGNDGWGIAGVSWHARIMPLRILDETGTNDTARAIQAIEYASANGARVINISWGNSTYSQAMADTIAASPALVVCAAGNTAKDIDAVPHYPASYGSSNILVVAATDALDQLASFSNYGTGSVDVAAPGARIYSAVPGRNAFWLDDFEDGSIADWTTGGTNSDWGLTSSPAFSGTQALADSPGANYRDQTDSWARTPPLDLQGRRYAGFEFRIRGASQSGFDRLYVEVSTDGTTWSIRNIRLEQTTVTMLLSGTFPDWQHAVVDLSDLDGTTPVYVRFRFVSDAMTTYDGWYIDDVALTEIASTYDGSEFTYRSGTSQAAPHVSGLAALLLAQNPAWTTAQVKAAILDTVDPLPSLAGKIATGGRINAARAVGAGGPPPEIVSIPLQVGWNLISWPLATCAYAGAVPPAVPLPSGVECAAVASLGDLFASIAGQYDLVTAFDGTGAHTYDPSLPAYVNDLTYLAGGYGYAIRMTEPGTLTLAGPRLPPVTPLPLSAGWNLAGYWGADVRYLGTAPTVSFPAGVTFTSVASVPEMFPGLGTALTNVWSHDAGGDHTYPGAEAPVTPLGYAGPGYGYWLKLNTPGSLAY